MKKIFFILLFLISLSTSAYASSYYEVYNLTDSSFADCTGLKKGDKITSLPPSVSRCFSGYTNYHLVPMYSVFYIQATSQYGSPVQRSGISFIKRSCPQDQVFNGSQCEEQKPETCNDLEAKEADYPDATPNDNKPITAKRFSCDTSNMCEVYSGYSVFQTETGSTYLGKWAQYTGFDCVGAKEDYEDNPFYQEQEKDPLPDGCIQSPIESQGYFCNQDTSGDGKPNIDADLDSDAYCNYDENGKFTCSGGSYESFPGQGDSINQTPPFPYDPNEIEKPDDLETVEKPQLDNSTEVIDAIKNVNTNLSTAITDSTNKTVEGFNSLNQQLTELRITNASIGQTIVDQMNQDRVIYEKTESLLLANKKDIVNATVNAASSIKGAIGDQTATLTDSIDSLADKICDPSTDERACQGEHGLTEGYANQAYQEMVTAYEGEISSAISTIQSSVIEQSKLNHTEEIESEIHKLSDLLFSVLPDSGNCDIEVLHTPLGDFNIGCEFSVRLKEIIGFVFYIFTLYSLIEILLNGVTPQSVTVPYMSRRS